MVTAGLGGDWGMFSIREWVPQSSPQAANGQWKKLSLGGDRSNLKPGTPYQIEVVVNGSSIGLAVNNVQVAVTTLPSAITQARQIGIFFASRSKVIVSDVIIDVDRPKAFIVMQFSSP